MFQIQRCKTVILWNGSALTFPTQFLRCNSRRNLSLHLNNYYISWCYSVHLNNYYISWCYKRILLERGLPYTLKSPNKQLMQRFLHFVVRLQSRFYTLALISVLNVNIYSSSLRLFKIHSVVSLLLATNWQYLILALSLPLRWLRSTFVLNTLIGLNYTLKTLWLNSTRNWVNNPPNTFLVKLTHFLVKNYRLNKNLVYYFGLLTRNMVNFF